MLCTLDGNALHERYGVWDRNVELNFIIETKSHSCIVMKWTYL